MLRRHWMQQQIPRRYVIYVVNISNTSVLLSDSDHVQAVNEFNILLQGAVGDSKSKQLTATLIPKYVAFFPDCQESALNALIDLCEEDLVQIRVMAIRALAAMTKVFSSSTDKVAFVLSQLLVSDDPVETRAVRESYQTVLSLKPQCMYRVLSSS